MPEPASPAMESPATTATATGRKIGSTIASAAAGYSDPLDRTADSSAGPWPGGGARWVTATNTATTTGSPHSSARLTQLLGRRTSFTSSTQITPITPDHQPLAARCRHRSLLPGRPDRHHGRPGRNRSRWSSISYELGTSAFGTDLGSGTVALNASNSHFLFSNSFGYDIYDVTIGITPAALTAGNTYWLSLSNATDAGNSGTEAWDLPNGGSGGPATCNFRQSGTNFGDCGLGGEAFTLDGCCVPPVPEPGSILLFGSGILGLAGILRRKRNI